MKMYEKTIELKLSNSDDIKNLTNTVKKCPDLDITLTSGRFSVNGKSIIGIMSLSLKHTMQCLLESDDMSEIELMVKEFGEYGLIVED